MTRSKPSMVPVYIVSFAIASLFVGAVVAAGYLLR
jgi:hypothetical protein